MPRDAARNSLLVVDDDEGMRLLLGLLGAVHGYDVVTAASADHAIALLDGDRRFAVVISDFSMPGGSGLELLRWVKRRLPSCPFVLMSGLLPDGTRERARASGAAAVLNKQTLVDQFEAVLERVLPPLAA